MRLRLLLAAVCTLAALAGLSTIVSAKRGEPQTISVQLRDAGGALAGTVKITGSTPQGAVDVRVNARGLTAGFHGFHVHAVGKCEGPSFMSAEGHLKDTGENHPAHSGDLSSLLVKPNGTATLRVTTGGFTLDDLRDADGSAVMVHAGPDNFANIPPRYAPAGPDQATLDTGDSGARVACGVIGPGAR
ncbi:MAG: superoxide dismutase family protein [Actinomycetota bacterium]|nr:superoxide dismutase family protein [Actinomycetota bacterium]